MIVACRSGRIEPAIVDRAGRLLETVGAFHKIWSGPRSAMFVEGSAIPLAGGAVAGLIHRRGSTAPLDDLSAADAAIVVAGRGQFLTEAHWGGYVALIESDPDVHIVRAPLGDLPCLIADTNGAVVVASDIGLLALLTGAASIDWPALARQFAAPDMRHAETCLTGITELQGGLRLRIAGHGDEIDETWSPWRFAEPDRQIHDPEEAARRVRDAVLHAVAASSRPHGGVILRLSGGLDSSIVAAALAQAGIASHALNLLTEDAGGDERRYARLVAERYGIGLTEHRRLLGAVNLDRSVATNQPRPTARAFVQAATGPAYALAEQLGCGAVVDGGGGDNVFCSLQSMRPVLDCMIAGEPWTRTVDTVRSIAQLAQVSRWTVLRRAYTARFRHVSRYRSAPDLRFLSAQAIDAARATPVHRWLVAPDGALPGKAAHIGLVAAAQSVVESFDPSDPIPLVSPLISQPVVEACIKVPSWLWYDRGFNRAVARQAFADLVPRAIVERRSKGGLDSFIAALYRENRTLVRERLLDGLLATNGLLDRTALAAATSAGGPVRGLDYFRIMRLFDAEMWARTR